MASALGRKGFGEEAILPVLERLRGEGLLNDERLSERVARSRIEGRGLGRHRVRRELFLRGVEKETAEKGLVSALAEVSETAALDSAARRYWASHKSVEPETRLRRLYVFLRRRGFPAPLVADRLHALWPRLRDVLDAEPLSADDLEGT